VDALWFSLTCEQALSLQSLAGLISFVGNFCFHLSYVLIVFVLSGSVVKPLPDPLDYTADWFKSGAGVPDPHSGILPSLVTVDITDFLSGPG